MSEKTLPVMYCVKDKSIPARLTQCERVTFARGLDVPEPAAVFLGTQDRAASLAAVLQGLVEQSGNPALLEKASQAIARWNAECDEFVATQRVRR